MYLIGPAILTGHAEDPLIMRSDDDVESRGESVELTDDQQWHRAACNNRRVMHVIEI